jgi:hypothetical protein
LRRSRAGRENRREVAVKNGVRAIIGCAP